MNTLRRILILILAALLPASCDPSAFGPQGPDPRSTAVPLARVRTELSNAGYTLLRPGAVAGEPGSIVNASGMVAPRPESVAVASRPASFYGLSADVRVSASDFPDLFGKEAAALLAAASVTDLVAEFRQVSVRAIPADLPTDRAALSELPYAFLAALSRAAQKDGDSFLLAGIVECRTESFRIFFEDPQAFKEKSVAVARLFGPEAGRIEYQGRRRALLSLSPSSGTVAVAARWLGGAGLDGALIREALSPAYTLRMDGIDDYGYAFVNDQEAVSGVDDDSGEVPIGALLHPGQNTVLFQVVNTKGELAYHVSVKARGRADWTWERACGKKGKKGCSRKLGMFEEKCVVTCDDAMQCTVK